LNLPGGKANGGGGGGGGLCLAICANRFIVWGSRNWRRFDILFMRLTGDISALALFVKSNCKSNSWRKSDMTWIHFTFITQMYLKDQKAERTGSTRKTRTYTQSGSIWWVFYLFLIESSIRFLMSSVLSWNETRCCHQVEGDQDREEPRLILPSGLMIHRRKMTERMDS
jgi:hypothetical protein